MNATNGGPAFPAHPSALGDHDGMTLRDYFAAKAMPVILSSLGPAEWESTKACATEVARLSYLMADAMLKARQS